MQLKMKRTQVGNKFRLEVRLELSAEERAEARKQGLQNQAVIYEPRSETGVKDITNGEPNILWSIITGMFPEIRGTDLNVDIETLQRGHVFQASNPYAISEIEEKIKSDCMYFQDRIGAVEQFQGAEEVVDLKTGESVARADPQG